MSSVVSVSTARAAHIVPCTYNGGENPRLDLLTDLRVAGRTMGALVAPGNDPISPRRVFRDGVCIP